MKAILTRSAYHADYPIEANRRRLELLRRVCARSLSSQDRDGWVWVVGMAEDDPLFGERVEAVAGAGLTFVTVLNGGWAQAVASLHDAGPYLTLRLDDDDALATGVLRTLSASIDPTSERLIAHVYPDGLRYGRGRVAAMHHPRNQFPALQSPASGLRLVTEVKHREIRTFADKVVHHAGLGWLWVRHSDARTGFRPAREMITDAHRAAFDVDWSYLAAVAV